MTEKLIHVHISLVNIDVILDMSLIILFGLQLYVVVFRLVI